MLPNWQNYPSSDSFGLSGVMCWVGGRQRNVVNTPLRRPPEIGSEPLYQAPLFQVNDCVLNLSERHEHRLGELHETDDARVSPEAMRQKKQLVVDRLGERIQRRKDAEVDRIRHPQLSLDRGI